MADVNSDIPMKYMDVRIHICETEIAWMIL